MIGAFDLSEKDGETGANRAQRLCRAMMKKKVLVRPLDATVYLMLPLVTDDEVLADTVQLLLDTLEDI
ncbi:MAG: hypothetical protein ABSE08_16730 [Syntrophobacteraceae bacterium]|jgi:adenosylmethionine-8-amino-7-oxononanoate aminotransferase